VIAWVLPMLTVATVHCRISCRPPAFADVGSPTEPTACAVIGSKRFFETHPTSNYQRVIE
jgi:hypothetical protein